MTDLIALSGSDIQAALPMPEAIEAMRSAFGALSGKRVELPHRVSLKTAPGAVTLVMPGALAASYGVGAKMVSVFDNNPAKGLPLVSGVTVLFDRDTGQPAAILDAHALTAIRTGAASGLATDLLAIPGGKRMAMLGAGAQARAQIAGVCAVRSIEELRLWSRTRERAEALAEQLSSEEWAPPSVKVVSDPSEAVVGTEIV